MTIYGPRNLPFVPRVVGRSAEDYGPELQSYLEAIDSLATVVNLLISEVNVQSGTTAESITLAQVRIIADLGGL